MTKKQTFLPLANYLKLFDGFGKPKINFQDLYRLFPNFDFTATREFGNYTNFGKAFEKKNYCMQVKAHDGNYEATMTYYEYSDADENLCYLTF